MSMCQTDRERTELVKRYRSVHAQKVDAQRKWTAKVVLELQRGKFIFLNAVCSEFNIYRQLLLSP